MKLSTKIISLSFLFFFNFIYSSLKLDQLYAPAKKHYHSNINNTKCPFCNIDIKDNKTNNPKNWVLKKFNNFIAILNLYPVNPGHLLIIPKKHCSSITDLTKKERQELMEIINFSVKVLEKKFKPIGFNIGLNMKDRSAGASIPKHLHAHIIPRYKGDIGFMEIIYNTKVTSINLKEAYNILKPDFDLCDIA